MHETSPASHGDGPAVYIRTYGCQMNVSDTATVETLLGEAGFRFVSTPEAADIVLVNTCAVRDSAETRALGQLSDLARLKKKNPHVVIGILGCVAQARKREILDEKPFVDLVVGPDSYRKLPLLLEERLISPPGTPGLLETTLLRDELYDDVLPRHRGGVSAFVTVMRGCDKFCSFCIVPRTRGRESSRPLPSIVREVEALVEQGAKDVMLLGQNVDSYRWEERTFSDCLSTVANVPGIRRVRFMTSHPADISDALLDTMSRDPRICPFLHLPVQAGNNRILGAHESALHPRTLSGDHCFRARTHAAPCVCPPTSSSAFRVRPRRSSRRRLTWYGLCDMTRPSPSSIPCAPERRPSACPMMCRITRRSRGWRGSLPCSRTFRGSETSNNSARPPKY